MAQTIAGVNIAIGADSAALVKDLAKAAKAVEQNTKKMADSFARVESFAQRAGRAVLGATAGYLTLQQLQMSARALMQYSDAWQEATNKINAAQAISGTTARSLEQITDIANEARVPLADLTDLYAKMLRVSGELAVQEIEVAQATETVSKAFKAGGASTLEQVNGIRQLAQALGSGILQGDELRSIRENAPLIAKAIADEFGTSIAGLKKLGAEGQLESDRVFKAILKSKDAIDAAFATTSPTISEAFTVLENAFIRWLAQVNKATGASNAFASALIALADNFPVVANAALNAIPGINAWRLAMVAAGKIKDAVTADEAPNAAGSNMGGNFFEAQAQARRDRAARMAADIINQPVGKGASRTGGFPLAKAAAEARAAEEALKALEQAQSDWAENTETTMTPAGERLHRFWESIPGLVESTMTPLEQYRNQLELIALSEEQLAAAGVSAATLRQQAVLGLAETALGAAGAMTGALAALFKENKAFAIANVIVHTAEAVVSALKNPPGPPFSYVYAAAAAVTGAAQLAAIMSAKPGGGKIASVKGGAGKKASRGESDVAAGGAGGGGLQQSVVIQIKGDIFGPEHFRKIVEGINGVQRDGTALIRME